MKERPILFSGPMVRALLAGRKTQTRRVVKGEALRWLDEAGFDPTFVADPANSLCPYGVPGDRLWVRETVACGACAPGKPSLWSPSFWRREQGTRTNPNGLWYAADGLAPSRPITERSRWVPAIHMPRWASRLTLEITDVRVERLVEISEADAEAEGVTHFPHLGGWSAKDTPEVLHPSAALAYEALWSIINGPDSWAANPWTWAVSFRVLEQGA